MLCFTHVVIFCSSGMVGVVAGSPEVKSLRHGAALSESNECQVLCHTRTWARKGKENIFMWISIGDFIVPIWKYFHHPLSCTVLSHVPRWMSVEKHSRIQYKSSGKKIHEFAFWRKEVVWYWFHCPAKFVFTF